MTTMKASELIKVIKCCKESGVKRLQVGEVLVEFDGTYCTNQEFSGNQDESIGDLIPQDTDVLSSPPLSEESSDYQSELELSQNLILSDPIEYEKQVFESFANHDGDE